MEFDIHDFIKSVSPSENQIREEISEMRCLHPKLSNDQLAHKWGKRIRNNYTSFGVVTALPSVFPGLGTAAQLALEAGTITSDFVLMVRWMSKMCMGISIIYGNSPSMSINQDLIYILGLWCGAIDMLKTSTTRVSSKVATVQISKLLSADVLKRINTKIGRTVLTKQGTKRGGIALGKLVPFGVGAVVAGGFNYFSFNRFLKKAINYYKTDATFVVN